MKQIVRFALWLSVMAMVLGLTAAMALAAPPAQNPDNGKAAWDQALCKNCHGAAGEGKWAGPLAGSEKTAEEFVAQVRSPRNRMPHFSPEKVSDQMVIDMHAYLTSLPKPAAFTPADAGLPADAPAGQQLIVEKRCVACHTTTGPIQGFIDRGETPTAQIVITQLRTPRNNMPMFAVEQVSDEEAGLIAEFLASQVSQPPSLPATGSSGPSGWLLILPVLGGVLLLAGLALRGVRARS
jgi:mono/diheme cytochrome c family protein